MTAMVGFWSRLGLSLFLALVAQPVLAKDVKRCGWYANPTPGNHWLTDADATWDLAIQGEGGVPGWDDLPPESFDFDNEDRWVRINGYYGYGCACITGRFDSVASGRVIEITSMQPLALSRCLADPKLPSAAG